MDVDALEKGRYGRLHVSLTLYTTSEPTEDDGAEADFGYLCTAVESTSNGRVWWRLPGRPWISSMMRVWRSSCTTTTSSSVWLWL